MSDQTGYIGYGFYNGASGSATVSGSSTNVGIVNTSMWSNSAGLYVGYNASGVTNTAGPSGTGTLTVANGGVVHSPGVVLANAGAAQGTVNLNSSGVLEAFFVGKGTGTGGGALNFNGGILRALGNNSNFLSGFAVGDVTLNSGGGTIDNNGFNITVAAPLGGAGRLTSTGSGTLTLTGNNTYGGGTAVNGGTLSLGSSGALGTTGTISFGGGILQFTSSNSTDYSSRFSAVAGQQYAIDTNGQNVTFASALTSNGGSLTKNGPGFLILSAANTYTGGTTVNGTLQLSGAGTLGAASSALTVNTGGEVDLNGTSQTVGNLIGAGGTGGDILNNASGTSSTLTIGSGDATGGSFNGLISDHSAGTGTVALTKIGAGTLTLSGPNAYSGPTTISSGALQFAQAWSLYGGASSSWTSTSIAVGNGATLGLNVGGAHEFTAANVATLLSLGSTNGGFTAGSNIALDATNATGGNFVYGGNIVNPNGNALGLTTSGTGTLTLTGSNSYTGVTLLGYGIGGMLNLGSSGALGGGGAITFGSGSGFGGNTLQYSAANNNDYSSRIVNSTRAISIDTNGQNVTYASSLVASNTGGLVKLGTGTLTLGAANAYTGGTFINVGTLALANSGALGGGGAISFGYGGATLQYSAANTVDYSSRISGSIMPIAIDTNGQNVTFASALASNNAVGLTKLGSGTLTLTGKNNYAGTTTVTGGELDLNATGGPSVPGNLTVNGGTAKLLQSSQVASAKNLVVSNGVFDLQTFNQTVANVQISGGTIAGSGGTLTSTSAYAVQAGMIAAKLAGSVSFSKTTSGAATLSGANIYTGGTTVGAGTLYVNNTSGSGTGTGSVTVSVGATLAGSGIITPTTGTGVVINSGASLYSGGVATGVPATGPGTGMTLNNSAGLSTILSVDGDAPANLTFALGAGNPTSAGYNTFGNPNTSSTFLTVLGNTAGEISFSGIDSITLVDTTDNQTLSLRQGVPYLLIQAQSGGASVADDAYYSGLVTSLNGKLDDLQLDGNGYVLGVWAGGGNPLTDFTAITINQQSLTGPLTGSQIYSSAQLYLYNGDLEVVPEPGTFALVIAGLAALVYFRRRGRA